MQLAMYWKPLPMLVLGLPSLVSGCLVFMIPETKGKELPQTMNDAVKMDSHLNPETDSEIVVNQDDLAGPNEKDEHDSPILTQKFAHLEERD